MFETPMGPLLAVIALSYLFGAIPFAYLYFRFVRGVRLTEAGTGTIGIINSFAVGGVAATAVTVLGEISKAAMAGVFAFNVGDGSVPTILAAVFAAFIGTNYSVFLKGRGGKGATVLLWGQGFITFWVPITVGIIAGLLLLVSKWWIEIKRGWVLFIAPLGYIATESWWYVAFGIAASVVILVRTTAQNDDWRHHGFWKDENEDDSLIPLSKARKAEDAGSKAARLRKLLSSGIPVPDTQVVNARLFDQWREDPVGVKAALRKRLEPVIQPDVAYAVRSSANVEDQPDHSFAGQFESVLDVTGLDAVVDAVETVWQSAASQRVDAYAKRKDLGADRIRMAVMVQTMVRPVFSGVAFSHNPVNGLNETVIEAVPGRGTALVQDGVTPERWVRKWGAWSTRPTEPELAEAVALELAERTDRLSERADTPVDMEWVYDGETVYTVQLRDVTGLDDINVYSNRISKEFLPGAIKPLIWSINIPLVNGAWVRMLTEFIGPNDIDPNSLAKSIYFRAYFNMGVLGRILERMGFAPETIELLLGLDADGPDKPKFKPSLRTFARSPRMFSFAVDKFRFPRKLDRFLAQAEPAYAPFDRNGLGKKSDQALWDEIERLYAANSETAYYNVLTPLLNGAYHGALASALKRHDLVLDNVADYIQATSGGDDDPMPEIARLHGIYEKLPGDLKQALKARGATVLSDKARSELAELRAGFESFLTRFGHFSDSGNDFSVRPWRELPDAVLNMIIHHVPGEDRAGDRRAAHDLPFWGPRRMMFNWTLRRAIAYKHYRDRVSSIYTMGYGLFRDYFLEIGNRLTGRGALMDQDDVFFLSYDEVKALFLDGASEEDPKLRVARRRKRMDTYADVDPLLPSIVYGDEEPVLSDKASELLSGVPTSGGLYSGPVTVVKGLADFHKVKDGDVLAVPYSDVGWTPLFAKAGAIIAESGGLLSHSSIVAREYGIPAVVSVNGACGLDDGTVVTVDGHQGLVRVDAPERSSAA